MKHGGHSTLEIIRILIPKGQRWKWLLVAFMGIALALAESVAAVSIAVLIDAMTTGIDGGGIELPIVGRAADFIPGGTARTQLLVLTGGMALFFLLKGGLALAQTYTSERVAENTGARVGSRLFAGYMDMPYGFHIENNSAELIRNASWATDEVIRSFLKPVANILTQVAMLGFLVAVLVAAAPTATMITIGALAPLTWLAVRLVKPSLNRLGKATKLAVGAALRSLQQSLHGIRDVKVLRREAFFGQEYKTTRYALARAKYMQPSISEIPRVTVETLLVLGLLAFVASTGGLEDGTSLALLGMFAYAGLRMMPAVSAIVAAVNKIRYGFPIASTLFDDLVLVEATARRGEAGSHAVVEFADRITLRDVNFEYESGQPVLKNIDLEIRRGETIGIVGETGAGKSTLLDVILGLLPPTSGTVTVDGVEMAEILEGWHNIIGLVPQSIYLLDDSIRRNIAYGMPDRDIDEDAVRRSLELARLDRFVSALPKGLDTEVGERGVRLSGGQGQRIAIARALYRDPQVLILDEGTASLDNVTEAELMNAIDPLKGELTIIMVAHRLSTVMGCDRIFLVSDGEIADEGPFEELRSRNLEFRKMTG